MKQRIRYFCLTLLVMVAGMASAQDVIEISTVQQLEEFRDAVNGGNQYAGKTVKLTADLDLSGEANWKPIGNLVAYPGQSFNGTFDGQNHTISNLTVNDNTPNYAVAALFGSVVNGTIKNLTVKNVNITSTHYAAGIVAYTSNTPTIENCHVIGGTIKSTPEIVNGSYDNGDKVGGIMGYATDGSTINNCTVEGVTISGYRDIGGIVGYSNNVTNNTVKNVTVTQDLTNAYEGTPNTIGDIIGRGSATLSNNTVIKSDPVAQIDDVKYETLAEAVAAANEGNVIQIIKAGDYTLPILSKNVTIEGKADGVVSFTHTTAGSVASIPNGATFKNVTFNFGNVNYHGFQHAGTINMENCTLNGKFFSYADMNFTNCQFVQDNADYHMWCYAGNVTYNSCTFTNSATGKFLNIYNEDGATKYTVTVNNCKFVNNAAAAKAALNVKATCGSKLLAYDVIINGCTTEGAFPEASSSQVLVVLNNLVQVDDRTADGVDNITVTQDGKKIYPVNYVAQIGETKYETLEAAWAEVKDGETITLLADCTGNGIKAPQGKFTTGVTIDFNNHTYTMDGSTVGSSGTKTQAFQLLKDNKITFKNGSIIANNADVKMMIQNYSDLTLDNMTLDATQGTNSINYVLSTNNGNAVIKDTKITAKEGGKAFDVDSGWGNYASNTVELTGESVITGDIEVAFEKKTEGTPSVLKLTSGTLNGKIVLGSNADECTITKSDNFVAAAPADHKWVDNGNGTSMLKPCEYVAQIEGGAKFESLEAAFAAATDGATITLLANSEGNGIIAPQGKFNTTGLTVNFNNFTYTITGPGLAGSTGTKTQAFQLLKDNKITFKNGAIVGNNADVKMMIQNYSDLTLDNMTLDATQGTNSINYVLSTNNGNTVIKDTKIIAKEGGKAFDADSGWGNYASNTVELTGESVITGDIEVAFEKKTEGTPSVLKLTSGTLNGKIVLGSNADECTITKSDNFVAAAPADHKWVDNGDGTSMLKPCEYVAQIEGGAKFESLEAAFAAATDGATITLLANSEGNGIIAPQGKFKTTGLTVNFNNFTYTITGPGLAGSTGTKTQAFQLLKDNKITFKNGAIVGNNADVKMMIQNYSDLTLDKMVLDATQGTNNIGYVLSTNNGNTVINNTKITAKEGGKVFDADSGWGNYASNTVELTGESVINGDIEVAFEKKTEGTPSVLKLTSGTLNGNIVLGANADECTVTKSDAFEAAAPADHKWVDNGDGTSTLKPCEYVAQIGDVKYESLAEAVAAVKDGDTILMLADVPNAGGMSVSSGKNFTVDFQNHTYTLNKPGAGSTGTETSGFQLLKNSTIVFKNGTINISEENLTKAVDPAKNIMRIIQNYANLTLENMTIDGTNQYGGKDYIMSFNNGTSVIKDTKVVGADKIAFDVCTWSSYKATSLDVTGNSEIKGDIEISSTNTPDALSLMLTSGTHDGAIIMAQGADKATVSKVNEFVQAAPEGYKWVDNGNGTSTLKPCEYICAIGDVKYESLQDAVNAAGTAETTITLLTEVAADGVISGNGVKVPSGSNITFDLNGLTYDVSGETVGSPRTETNGFQLLKNSNITFKNGTLKATSPTAQMLIQNYSNLTLEDVNLDGTTLSEWAYALSNNCGTINLTGSTSITAKDGGRAFDTCKFGSYAIPTVNINTTGTITGPIEATGGKLNIENGKFDVTWVTDSHYAAGDIQIKGGVFTAEVAEEYCAEGFVCTSNDDATYKFTVKSKEEAGIYELIDGTPYPESLRANGGHAKEVTYTHKFAGAVYSCWWVPFNYTISDEDAAKFDFYTIHMIAGAKAAGEIEETGKIWIYLSKQKSGKLLKAGHIYVIKPTKAINSYTFKATDVDLLSENSTTSRKHTETSDYAYDFFGTYVGYETTKPNDVMWLSKGGTIDWNLSSGAKLGSYRWFIRVTSKTGSDDADAKIAIGFKEDEGDTNGINNAQASEGEIEGIYTLGGMKVEHPVKGVNIIKYTDGRTKKIYVK